MLISQTFGFQAPPPESSGTVPVDPGAQYDRWTDVLQKALQHAGALKKVEVPKRESILGPWFRQGDLGFIYGPRGLGKTWLALHIARSIAEGSNVAMWRTARARTVLYIDGEMPLDGLRERDAALAKDASANMLYLQHEALFHSSGEVLNLADPILQTAVTDLCRREQVEVLFLDNLSCLFSGIKENDADGWERVLPWLLEMRRNRVAVVFIAHAGRNGFIRGTSRREDAAFWILQLAISDRTDDSPKAGARFVARFDKNRNATETDCPPIEWNFSSGLPGDPAQVKWHPVSSVEKLRYWVEQGLTCASDIALEMGVTKGRVSQLARVAIEEGWLRRAGREYALIRRNAPDMNGMNLAL